LSILLIEVAGLQLNQGGASGLVQLDNRSVLNENNGLFPCETPGMPVSLPG
jgi:hypothetical protein